MLYDTRRHCFVDVDGVKKFKYVTDMTYSGKIEDNDSGYYEVKMSQNVTAWIDWNTNKPLKKTCSIGGRLVFTKK